jgi:hypothetical protein
MPRVLAHQHGRAPPRRFEGAHGRAALHEALLVEEPVGGQVVLAVHVPHHRRAVREADREVGHAVEQRVAPPLVEADDHIERDRQVTRRLAGVSVGFVEVRGEAARGGREFAHAALHEVAGERRLRKLDHLRRRRERGCLRAQSADARQVAGEISLARRELAHGEGERTNGFSGHTGSKRDARRRSTHRARGTFGDARHRVVPPPVPPAAGLPPRRRRSWPLVAAASALLVLAAGPLLAQGGAPRPSEPWRISTFRRPRSCWRATAACWAPSARNAACPCRSRRCPPTWGRPSWPSRTSDSTSTTAWIWWAWRPPSRMPPPAATCAAPAPSRSCSWATCTPTSSTAGTGRSRASCGSSRRRVTWRSATTRRRSSRRSSTRFPSDAGCSASKWPRGTTSASRRRRCRWPRRPRWPPCPRVRCSTIRGATPSAIGSGATWCCPSCAIRGTSRRRRPRRRSVNRCARPPVSAWRMPRGWWMWCACRPSARA